MPDITIRIEDREVQRVFHTLIARGKNLRPFLKAVGETVVLQTEKRFDNEGPAPDGTAWPKLKESTWRQKKHSKILTESGELRGSIRYQLIGNDTVAIGTNKVYGAIHQLGGKTGLRTIIPVNGKALYWPGAAHPVRAVKHPGSNIPARPYMGLSRENSDEIVEMANRYLMR